MSDKLYQDIIDFFYSETKKNLEDIAKKHRVSVAQCEEVLEGLKTISYQFESFPEEEPSTLSLNKIRAYAKEKAASLDRVPLWKVWLKPATLLASITLVSFGLLSVGDYIGSKKQQIVAVVPTAKVPTNYVHERLLSTPFEKGMGEFFSSSKNLVTRPTTSVPLANVSVGNNEFAIDDEFEKKMHSKSLDVHDVETLYFRARKFEKLGYYKEALNDYIFLNNNYPNLEYNRTIPLNVALCYEKLGEKQRAIDTLEAYEKAYGENEDITFWIDQLKSVTF